MSAVDCSSFYEVVRQTVRIQRAFRDAESSAKTSTEIAAVRKHIGDLQAYELDRLLMEWINYRRAHDETFTDPDVEIMAQQVAPLLGIKNFNAYGSWVVEFKSRHLIRLQSQSGRSSERSAPIDDSDVPADPTSLPTDLKSCIARKA